jgi:hypothetical protein
MNGDNTGSCQGLRIQRKQKKKSDASDPAGFRKIQYNMAKLSKIRLKLILDAKASGKIVKIKIRSNWLVNRLNFTKNRPRKIGQQHI